MKHLLLLPFFALLLSTAHAQTSTFKKHELYYGIGILSVDEFRGFFANEPVSPYMSFPYGFSAAQFFSYRYRITKWFSAGASIGLDIQGGDLSYGDEHHGSFGGYNPGVSGRYGRYAYTFAAEAAIAFIRKNHFRFSAYAGWGYSLAHNKYTFFQGIMAPEYFYGTPNSLVPTNPYTFHRDYYTYQVTPFSLRFGGKVAGFFDIGFGYKGIFSGGLAMRL